MKYKKIIIAFLALIAFAAVIYGVWAWQQNVANQPVRQDQEIR